MGVGIWGKQEIKEDWNRWAFVGGLGGGSYVQYTGNTKGGRGWGGFLKQLGPEGFVLWGKSCKCHSSRVSAQILSPNTRLTLHDATHLLSSPCGHMHPPRRATQLELALPDDAHNGAEYHFSTRRILSNEYVSLHKLPCGMVDTVLAMGCICTVVSYQTKKVVSSFWDIRPSWTATRPLTPRMWADQAMLESHWWWLPCSLLQRYIRPLL